MEIKPETPFAICLRCEKSAPTTAQSARFIAGKWQSAGAVARPAGWTAGPAEVTDTVSGLCIECSKEWDVAAQKFLDSPPVADSLELAAPSKPFKLPRGASLSRAAVRADVPNIVARATEHAEPEMVQPGRPMLAEKPSPITTVQPAVPVEALNEQPNAMPAQSRPDAIVAKVVQANTPQAVMNGATMQESRAVGVQVSRVIVPEKSNVSMFSISHVASTSNVTISRVQPASVEPLKTMVVDPPKPELKMQHHAVVDNSRAVQNAVTSTKTISLAPKKERILGLVEGQSDPFED